MPSVSAHKLGGGGEGSHLPPNGIDNSRIYRSQYYNSFEEFFEKDSLNTLKTISEARIAYHGATACGDLSAT